MAETNGTTLETRTTWIRRGILVTACAATLLIGAVRRRDRAASAGDFVSHKSKTEDSFEERVIKEALRYAAADLLNSSSAKSTPVSLDEPVKTQRASSAVLPAATARQYLHATVALKNGLDDRDDQFSEQAGIQEQRDWGESSSEIDSDARSVSDAGVAEGAGPVVRESPRADPDEEQCASERSRPAVGNLSALP